MQHPWSDCEQVVDPPDLEAGEHLDTRTPPAIVGSVVARMTLPTGP